MTYTCGLSSTDNDHLQLSLLVYDVKDKLNTSYLLRLSFCTSLLLLKFRILSWVSKRGLSGEKDDISYQADCNYHTVEQRLGLFIQLAKLENH